MDRNYKSKLQKIVKKYEKELLGNWLKEQMAAITLRSDLIGEAELRTQSGEFLALFSEAVQKGSLTDIMTPEWNSTREFLTDITRSRVVQGFLPLEVATFIFSLKQPLFTRIRDEFVADAEALYEEIWVATVLLDRLGLFTAEMYQKTKEDIIKRQQEEMLELSTPVVKLWDGVLALPLIGTLDSARTQVVMESLLQKIVETGSGIAIIDITGVPTVDTLVAQHLLKTVAAARLMGADCIISGIRPQIAQTIVQLGVVLSDVVTKANLSDAFAIALQKNGYVLTRTKP
jgi:rsbT co-antagonist protein RsbR